AFPDIHFDLTDIVIGPQGVCEEAIVTATQEASWLGVPPAEGQLEWRVGIWVPWDPEQRLFRGEGVYSTRIEIPAFLGTTSFSPGTIVADARWFRCWIFQIPSRGSPAYVRSATDQSVSPDRTT